MLQHYEWTLSSADVHVVLLALLELNNAVCEGKQSVILAATNILARGNVRATLTNDDLPSLDCLATKNLGAKTLRARVTTVTRSALAFLVSHYCTCLSNLLNNANYSADSAETATILGIEETWSLVRF